MKKIKISNNSDIYDIIKSINNEIGTTNESFNWFPHYHNKTKDVLMIISCNDDNIKKICEAFDYLKGIDIRYFILGLKSYEDLKMIKQIATENNNKCYEIARLFDNIFYVFMQNEDITDIDIDFKIKDKNQKWIYTQNSFIVKPET